MALTLVRPVRAYTLWTTTAPATLVGHLAPSLLLPGDHDAITSTGISAAYTALVRLQQGFEEIPLDLTRVPSVDAGLEDADRRYHLFTDIASNALEPGPGSVLFREHLTLVAFINRASSLHKDIVSAVRDENPHAAFTLLRAYLEAVVTLLYIDSHPEYVEALERPPRELPPRTRKRWEELFSFAAGELRGVRTVYAVLNEMAHFGSTALWHPFRILDERERRLDLYTGPRWRDPDDARIALAMLRESDEAMAEVLRRYDEHHIAPQVQAFRERERIRAAFAARGAEPSDDPAALGVISQRIATAAIEAGLLEWCEEHSSYEIAAGVTAADIDAWVEP